eukprot:gene25676-25836_t
MAGATRIGILHLHVRREYAGLHDGVRCAGLDYKVVVQTPPLIGRSSRFEAGPVAARGVRGQGELAHDEQAAVLACAIGFASRRHGPSAMLIGFVGALLVGGLDEFSQMRLPGRTAELNDLVADAVGAALGTVVLAIRIQ